MLPSYGTGDGAAVEHESRPDGGIKDPRRKQGILRLSRKLPHSRPSFAPAPAMFCKASLLALALALVASAAPLVEETGTRIPLQKRGSLTKSDGTFDREKAIRHNVKIAKCVS